MIQEAIHKIVDKRDLTYDEAYATIDEIMSGSTTPTQTAAFLAALSTKSTKAETIDEIAGCAAAMRDKATRVDYAGDVLEIVGTGGDGAQSFNISTTASMVIAAGGVKVAKHGNRAASSKSGAADCLEALGVNIEQSPERARKLLDEMGICFLFAQKYHSAMKHVGPIRRELGIRTVFNILGPLTNPAHPAFMVMGVYDGSLVEPLAIWASSAAWWCLASACSTSSRRLARRACASSLLARERMLSSRWAACAKARPCTVRTRSHPRISACRPAPATTCAGETRRKTRRPRWASFRARSRAASATPWC